MISLWLRSLAFNVGWYLGTAIIAIVGSPILLMPRRSVVVWSLFWIDFSLGWLRLTCRLTHRVGGLENMPSSPVIFACKHQSSWETYALFMLLPDPTYVLKRELMWLPLFGWLATKARMIPIDRGSHAKALASMTAAARREAARGRQIVIFPEGTRRPPGAKPRYLPGVAFLYAELGLPCVPIALNSGLFWPRRSLRRHPGTVLVEVLDAIPPGLEKREFLMRLQNATEQATARLVAEGERSTHS